MNIRQFVEQLVIRQKSFAYDPQRFTSYEKYSTDEQVIGEWIDGKPLYQRTLVFNNLSAEFNVEHGIPNIDRVINFDGYVDGTQMFPINYAYPNILYSHTVFINRTTFGFRCGTGSGAIGKSMCLTIKYTKTTD